jgi:hypothetical protein
VAFAAVGQVASGVALHDVAPLSQSEIDSALVVPTPSPTSTGAPQSTTAAPASTLSPTTDAPSVPVATTAGPTPTSAIGVFPTTPATPETTPTHVSVLPPLTAPSTPPTTRRPTTPTSEPTTTTSVPRTNTVTTSRGGTLFARCSAPTRIVYVAAVPKTGYDRTVDVEKPGEIRQVFVNQHHKSTITAECSHGVVHAEVEEESRD